VWRHADRRGVPRVAQDWLWYDSYFAGDGLQNSGAYVFRPNCSDAFAIDGGAVHVTVQQSDVVTVVTQVWQPWMVQELRLWHGDVAVELEYSVGPIPVVDGPTDDDWHGTSGPMPIPIGGSGKEVISRFSTSIDSEDTFFTDSNGREMMQRVRNQRPTWNWTSDEPVAGNYYPVTTAAFIRDGRVQMTVATDRAQGRCSSPSLRPTGAETAPHSLRARCVLCVQGRRA
jgi:lysosomal alpha-mannosidase